MAHDGADLHDFCAFIKEKEPNAEAILTFLRRGIDHGYNIQPANSLVQENNQFDRLEKVVQERLQLLTCYVDDKVSIKKVFEEIAGQFQKLLKDEIQKGCEDDKMSVVTKKNKKSQNIFFVSDTA
jgi:hypothetical protein